MFEAVWALLLRDRGAETWLIGVTLSLFTVPMIFLAPIGGRTAQQRGPLRVVTVSLAVAAVCTFSYGVLPSLWMLLAVSVVHACADSFTMPGNQVSVAMSSPPGAPVVGAGPPRRDRARHRGHHRAPGRGRLRVQRALPRVHHHRSGHGLRHRGGPHPGRSRHPARRRRTFSRPPRPLDPVKHLTGVNMRGCRARGSATVVSPRGPATFRILGGNL